MISHAGPQPFYIVCGMRWKLLCQCAVDTSCNLAPVIMMLKSEFLRSTEDSISFMEVPDPCA